MRKTRILRVIYASLFTFFLNCIPISGFATTATFGVNNLATGILDLESDSRLLCTELSVLSSAGIESLISTSAGPAGRKLPVVIDNVLAATSKLGILTNTVISASDGYLVPGKVVIEALTLMENRTQGLVLDVPKTLRTGYIAQPVPVPLPEATWLFAAALIGFVFYSRRTKVS